MNKGKLILYKVYVVGIYTTYVHAFQTNLNLD